MSGMRTLELARSISDDLVALRRELHQYPELGLHLPETQRRVLEALEGLDLGVRTGTGLSSVVAVLRGGADTDGDGPVVLLRGDMDALPGTEQVDVPYASKKPGLMHACGHDLHVAALVGAARILHAMRDELPGDVVFMFQPAEEGPGGAEPMIAEGLLTAAGRVSTGPSSRWPRPLSVAPPPAPRSTPFFRATSPPTRRYCSASSPTPPRPVARPG